MVWHDFENQAFPSVLLTKFVNPSLHKFFNLTFKHLVSVFGHEHNMVIEIIGAMFGFVSYHPEPLALGIERR